MKSTTAPPAGHGALLGLVMGCWFIGSETAFASDLDPMTYAAAQAAAGRAVYMRSCAACHGNELEGGGAPGLAGATFSHWIGAPAADLFEFVQVQMPADQPGSLSGAQVAGILAYLAQQNGLPASDPPVPNSKGGLAGLSFGQQPSTHGDQ